MKKGVLIAAIAIPVAAAAAGFTIARIGSANANDARGYCDTPTVYIDMAEGVSTVTAGPDSNAQCDGAGCIVVGAEQVEIDAQGRVQCVTVGAGRALSLTRQGDGSLLVEERAAH